MYEQRDAGSPLYVEGEIADSLVLLIQVRESWAFFGVFVSKGRV